MTIITAIVIAVLLIIIGVLIARLHQQHERTLGHLATIFALDETVTDLEAKLRPFEWRIPDTEMQSTVTKGRPDLPAVREAAVPSGVVQDFTDIDDIPNLEAVNE
ncbi:hypothetical protein LCGC14_0873650 [marine sediment metagenome]|uniref:Uncharacterized protein n=1 Tax=marine sediment metagenome TaxID=412755 RepID=A0A0F9SAY6_9ZZZZ